MAEFLEIEDFYAQLHKKTKILMGNPTRDEMVEIHRFVTRGTRFFIKSEQIEQKTLRKSTSSEFSDSEYLIHVRKYLSGALKYFLSKLMKSDELFTKMINYSKPIEITCENVIAHSETDAFLNQTKKLSFDPIKSVFETDFHYEHESAFEPEEKQPFYDCLKKCVDPFVNQHYYIVPKFAGSRFGIAEDRDDAPRTWLFADNRLVFRTLKNCAINNIETEVVHETYDKNVRFFVDLDDHEDKCENFGELIGTICDNFDAAFFEFFAKRITNKDIINISKVPIVGNYNSAHIIFIIGSQDIVTATADQQIPFWKSFSKKLGIPIDLSVYRRNGQLRAPFSRKNGKFLMPESFQHPDDCFVNPPIGGQFDVWDIPTRMGIPTMYEIMKFQNILDNSILEIADDGQKQIGKGSHKRNIFVEAISRIETMHKTFSLDYTKKVAENFIRARCQFLQSDNKWNTVPAIIGRMIHKSNELIEKRRKSGKCNFYKNHEEFFKFAGHKEIIVCQKYIDFPTLRQGTACVVRSQCGTGKNYSFTNATRDKITVAIGHRISLCKQHVETGKKMGVEVYFYQDEMPEELPRHSTICLNSAPKFKNLIENAEIIFIDECEGFIDAMSHIYAERRNIADFDRIFRIIAQKMQIYASATAMRIFNFLARYSIPYFVINNVYRPYSDYECIFYKNKRVFMQALNKAKDEGKKLGIPCSTKKKCSEINELFKNAGLKQTAIDKIVSLGEWDKNDAILYTSRLESGIDYTGENFDQLFAYATVGVNSYDAFYQMLFRIRKLNDKKIHIFIEGCSTNDYMSKKDIENQLGLDDMNYNFEEKAKLNFGGKNYNDPITQTVIENEYFKKHSRKYFSTQLRGLIANSGMKISHVGGPNEKVKKPYLDKEITQYDKEIYAKFIAGEWLDEEANFLQIQNREKISLMPDFEYLMKAAYTRKKIQENSNLKGSDILIKKFLDSVEYKHLTLAGAQKFFNENYNLFVSGRKRRNKSKSDILNTKFQYLVQMINKFLYNAGYKYAKRPKSSFYEFQDVCSVFIESIKDSQPQLELIL